MFLEITQLVIGLIAVINGAYSFSLSLTARYFFTDTLSATLEVPLTLWRIIALVAILVCQILSFQPKKLLCNNILDFILNVVDWLGFESALV